MQYSSPEGKWIALLETMCVYIQYDRWHVKINRKKIPKKENTAKGKKTGIRGSKAQKEIKISE